MIGLRFEENERPVRVIALIALLLLSISGPYAFAQQPNADSTAPGPETVPLVTPSVLAGVALAVNDGAVTSTEVITQLTDELIALKSTTGPRAFLDKAAPLINQAALRAVSDLLLYQHARRDIEKEDGYEEALEKAVADYRKELLAAYDGSAARAQVELAKTNSSLDDQLEAYERRIIIDRYRQVLFADAGDFTRTELFKYYRMRRTEEFYHPPQIQFQLIDIPVAAFLSQQDAGLDSQQRQAKARASAELAAQQAYEQTQADANFADVARQYSHGYRKSFGGLWRPVKPDSLQQKYAPVLEALETVSVGRCTDVIEAEHGFFIARLVDRREARQVSFAEAQFDIVQNLNQKRWMEYRKKLVEKLFAKATIGDLAGFVKQTATTFYEK